MIPVPIGELAREEWDHVATRSPQGWLFHHWEWNALEAEWTRSELLSFGIRNGAALVAIQPLYLSKLGLGTFEEILVHCGYNRHTGLAFDPQLPARDLAAVRTAVMNQIFDVSRRHQADRIHLSHQNLAPENLSSSRREVPFWVTEHRFELGTSLGPSGLAPAPGLATAIVDQIVDLRPSEDELFSALDESCRRAVRKGLKANCVAREVEIDESMLAIYLGLATASATRTGEAVTPARIYERVIAAASSVGLIRMIVVSIAGQDVAAAIVLSQKRGCYFLSGVSNPAFLDARVNDVLHWSSIQFAKRRGDVAYRLGPYFPAVPRDWPIEKVSRFKTKFGARPTTIIQGSRFLRPRRYRELALAHVERLCRELPEGVQ